MSAGLLDAARPLRYNAALSRRLSVTGASEENRITMWTRITRSARQLVGQLLSAPPTTRHVTDPALLAAFDADPLAPYLVSFPRTGSHWLRMLLELYFERPTLPRAFYFLQNNDFLLRSTQDLDLSLRRQSVIVLYRDPVATVYSQLRYHQEHTNHTARIRHWTNEYGTHLAHWLLDEDFTTRKTLVTYEAMQADLLTALRPVFAHLDHEVDTARFAQVAAQVTKQEVKRKTPHDEQVVQLGAHYGDTRTRFRTRYRDLVWQTLLDGRPQLRDYFVDLPPDQRPS